LRIVRVRNGKKTNRTIKKKKKKKRKMKIESKRHIHHHMPPTKVEVKRRQ
jgi:hypothetical protein